MTIANASLNLLMVDDDPDDIFLFEEAVKQSPVNIHISVADSTSFYNLLERKRPDIILMDINMPMKDGIEYLREIRSNKIWKDMPVIMYSTSKYKIVDAFIAGANKYFIKPNTFNDLKKVVQALQDKWWKAVSTSEPDNFYIDYTIS